MEEYDTGTRAGPPAARVPRRRSRNYVNRSRTLVFADSGTTRPVDSTTTGAPSALPPSPRSFQRPAHHTSPARGRARSRGRRASPEDHLLLLKPKHITQLALAIKMGVPVQRINTLVNGKRGVTAETAILLARVLGTTPEFWMNLQTRYDLWVAQARMAAGHR